MRRDPTEYMGKHTWYRIWNSAVAEAHLPFRFTSYQVRRTHASWLIDQGVDLQRVRHRLGHGDLTTTTRYVKVLDEEDSTAADVMSELLKAVGLAFVISFRVTMRRDRHKFGVGRLRTC